MLIALALLVAAAGPLDGCKPDPSSFDLVLQCPEVVASVEEEVGGDPAKMLEAHLANLVEDVPDVELQRPKSGARHAAYKHGDAVGTVDVVEKGGVTRVVACAGPEARAPMGPKDALCSAIVKELSDKGSDAVPRFFRARDVEKSWALDKGLAKTCHPKTRSNAIFEIDCESYGLMVAKADADDNKRTSNLRKYLMAALKTHELFDDDACMLHGSPARCIRADREDAHVIVAAGVVGGDPVQFRCDWAGSAELPALCALHLVVPRSEREPSR